MGAVLSKWEPPIQNGRVKAYAFVLLIIGGIADLPLNRKLLAICQKSKEPSFWEVMNSLVLLPYAILGASRTFLQGLIACLNFRFRRFILLVQIKKSDWFSLHWEMQIMLLSQFPFFFHQTHC